MTSGYLPDEQTQERILNQVRLGVRLETAAGAEGFHDIDDWVTKGKNNEEPYAAFLSEVRKAEAELEFTLVANLRSAAAGGNANAAVWLLERRFGQRWGKKSVNDSKAPQGASDKATAPAEPFAGLDNVESIDAHRKP